MALPNAPFGGLCPQLRPLFIRRPTLSRLRQPCVPHRHVRGDTRRNIRATPPSPREIIFCEPRMRKLTSFFRIRRRSRLVATPCGVSATGRSQYGSDLRGVDKNSSNRLMTLEAPCGLILHLRAFSQRLRLQDRRRTPPICYRLPLLARCLDSSCLRRGRSRCPWMGRRRHRRRSRWSTRSC